MRILLIIGQITLVRKRNGIPLLKTLNSPQIVTLEIVNQLRDNY